MKKYTPGFSLIELLTALSVASFLLSAGVPAFNHITHKYQATVESREIIESFQLARLYAINSQQYVTICGSSGHSGCDGNWSKGFVIFSHEQTDNTFVNFQQTPVIHRYKVEGDYTLEGNVRKITYRPSGVLKGRSGSLLYCPDQDAEKYKRRVTLSRGGRIRGYTTEQLQTIRYLSPMYCS